MKDVCSCSIACAFTKVSGSRGMQNVSFGWRYATYWPQAVDFYCRT